MERGGTLVGKVLPDGNRSFTVKIYLPGSLIVMITIIKTNYYCDCVSISRPDVFPTIPI